MVTAEKKDYFNKPGKIPEILPLGYVYPKMSIGIFDSPENKSKSRSRSSRRRGHRSKSEEQTDIGDPKLRFKVDLILARSRQKNRKKSKSPAKQPQSDSKRKPIDQMFREFISKSDLRLKRNEDLTRPLRMLTYRESVLRLLMQIMLLEESFHAQSEENKSKLALKEERFLAKESKLAQEVTSMNQKLDQVIQEAKKTVAEYEARLERISRENQENLTAKLKLQEEVMVLNLSSKEMAAEMKKEIAQLSTENTQLKASVNQVDLKYIDLMTQKLAELEQTVDEERMKAAISTQRHEQEMYDTQVDLVKARNQAKKLQNEREDLDGLLGDKNALIKKLNGDLMAAKNATETKVIIDLKDRVIQLEKSLVLKEAEILEAQREAEQRQAKSKKAELAQKSGLKEQLQTLRAEKERSEVRLKEEVVRLSEELAGLRRGVSSPPSARTGEPQTSTAAEEGRGLSDEEGRLLRLKVDLLEQKLKESDTLVRQQYEDELKVKSERVRYLEEQVVALHSKMKAEEERKLTLERVIMSMSAQSRLRRNSLARPEAGASLPTPQVKEKVKDSPFVQLLEKMREAKEKQEPPLP